ncbi:hypothetical protein PCE1_000848 [Barthelona sp. PCE]
MEANEGYVKIDGGEGGGQILRNSVVLSILTGTPFVMTDIRKTRPNQGLAKQHLTVVNTFTRTFRATASTIEGDNIAVGSKTLVFEPAEGEYSVPDRCDLKSNSASSIALMIQSFLPFMVFVENPPTLELQGGSIVSFSPPFSFFSDFFINSVLKMFLEDVTVKSTLHRHGFYPRGGARASFSVETAEKLKGFDFHIFNKQITKNVNLYFSLASDTAIVEAVRAEIENRGWEAELQIQDNIVRNPKRIDRKKPTVCLEISGPAYKAALGVSPECIPALFDEFDAAANDGFLDVNTADNIIMYAALAAGTTRFSVVRITNHIRTAILTVEAFLPNVEVQVEQLDDHAVIVINGCAFRQ